ncbi:hypothetical protein KR009_010970, partial [Drosophila setifemur]
AMNYRRKLIAFDKKLNLAKWYLGISDHQETLIFNMQNNLRDDFDQGTGDHMQRALLTLGLHPLITKSQIKKIVQLSRNNILAFLFFVLEGYYKTCRKDGVFSTNEKLLMVAIAKIDLVPTLRALHQILPPPRLSPLDLRRMEQGSVNNQDRAKANEVRSSLPKQRKPSKKSPYFQTLPRPVARISRMHTTLPDFVVGFKFWPNNGPPDYGEEEPMPWFAKYRLNPGQRLIKKTISETLERYFKLAKLESTDDSEEGEKSRESVHNLCLVHKAQLVESQVLRDEMAVKARDRCLELIDVKEPYAKIRRRRILGQLDHDIDLIMERHRMATHTDRTKVMTLDNMNCVLCQEIEVTQPWPAPGTKSGRALIGEDADLAHTTITDTYIGRRLEGGAAKPKEPSWKPPPRKLFSPAFRMTNIDIEPKSVSCKAPRNPSECSAPPAPKKTSISFFLAPGKIDPKGKNCEMRVARKRNKKRFFQGPRMNKPYNFKYHRVFQSGQQRHFDLDRIMCKSFTKALNKSESTEDKAFDLDALLSEIIIEEETPPGEEEDDETLAAAAAAASADIGARKSEVTQPDLFSELSAEKSSDDSRETMDRSSTHSRKSHLDHKAEILDAVERCAKAIWTKQELIKRAETERTERLTQRRALIAGDTEHFDPDSAEQMDKLLKDGLSILRKNERYVLASLPDAHKLPVMREWVKRRYGKVYCHKELEQSIDQANKLFEMVTLAQSDTPYPDLMGLDTMPRHLQNFDHYKEIKKTAALAKDKYHDQLNSEYLTTMNPAWYAMGNYLVPGGPPRKTFFAYIASNPQESMRNKVWNGEFRNIRQFRQKRMD